MAWVKIDDQAPRKGKMLKAGPAACWLWVCGIAHCQSQLTDGFISFEALPMIGVTGVGRCRKLADALVKVGLFDAATDGYRVHDYLDHNQARAAVLAKRADDADRKRRAEDKPTPRGIQPESVAPRAGIPSHPIRSVPKKETETRLSPAPSEPVSERAGRFVERYQALYQQHRHGALYAVKPHRDYEASCTLCGTWADERLDKLAVIFLTTDHKFAEEGSRTIPQFLALASWCDGKLAEHEATKAARA